ncbi:MAG: polysaccharide pyruvyl transferase family protein [Paracoccaceae bacterium]
MNKSLPSRELCTRLSDEVLSTVKILADGRSAYGLLDYPHHSNIGDSAIWVGEIAILNRLFGHGPAYVSQLDHDPAELGHSLSERHILFLHGGGNFGDIWPAYQRYRSAVIKHHPHHRIIQLPQSIHFDDPSKLEETKRVIGAHHDYHLLVRDRESFALAESCFNCPVYLVPDSAFGIGMSAVRRVEKPAGILGLFRTDKELRPDALEGRKKFEDCRLEDWRKISLPIRGVDKAIRRLLRAPVLSGPQMPRRVLFNAMATARVNLGFAQLDRAEVVVTDRLHGHIMSTLLGKPHVVIDNYYGKIARFIDAFGKDDVTLQANTYAEAREMADSLLQSVRSSR